MLIVSRHKDQRIQIGPDITLTVVDIAPGRVRIGIEAPDDVQIVRSEILKRFPIVEKDGKP